MRFCYWSLVLVLAAAPLRASAGEPAPRWSLQSGDRIVLLGSGLIEQERRFGHLETRLRRRWPDANLVFRNLGWAGDTVRGIARTGGYQNPEGFARLLKEVKDYKPTVLILGYGTNEAFDGPAGLASFREDYAKLLAKLAPLPARVLLLSPTHQQDLGRPFPDPANHNRVVDQYRDAIAKLAAAQQHLFVDLTGPLTEQQRTQPNKRFTTNGLSLNDAGSALVAEVMERQVGWPPRRWHAQLDASGKVVASEGVVIDELAAKGMGVRFRATDKLLAMAGDSQHLQIVGLQPGEYLLTLDGKNLLAATAAEWQRGVTVTHAALTADAENLRKAVIDNNELFYRRWRPFNDHSRHWGFIGGDGKLYDQQLAAQEKTIATLCRPRPHFYEIVRTGEHR